MVVSKSINPKIMNLFDAVPVVVKERYDGYTVGDSIATKDILETVSIVIDRCENFTRETLDSKTYMQIRRMVSNAIDLLLHDRRTFDSMMTDILIDDLWS